MATTEPVSGDKVADSSSPVVEDSQSPVNGGENSPLVDQAQSGEVDILPENITGQTMMSLAGRNVWGTEKDLDENAYGCAAVALVRESTTIAIELQKGGIKALTVVRLGCSMGIMVVNLILQFMILSYIQSYVVEPAVRDIQETYTQFHAAVFHEDGTLNAEAWENYAWKESVCQITMADSTFYYLIMVLWNLRILDELRKIQRFWDEVTSIRGCALAKEMVEFVDTDLQDAELGGRCLITHLTSWMRGVLLTFVCLPRAVIACYLLVLGCRWLSASPDFSSMVLNALALVFVTDIDELLYEAVLPSALKKQIADTNWFFIEDPKTKIQVEETEWLLYRRTGGWLFVMTAFLVVYGMFVQTVLPFGVADVREHCKEFIEVMTNPVCNAYSWGGLSAECYSFGNPPDKDPYAIELEI